LRGYLKERKKKKTNISSNLIKDYLYLRTIFFYRIIFFFEGSQSDNLGTLFNRQHQTGTLYPSSHFYNNYQIGWKILGFTKKKVEQQF